MPILRVLTDPAEFFDEESEDPDLLTPAIIVLAAALLTVTSTLPMLDHVEQSLTGDAERVWSILYISSLVGGFLGDIIVWVVATAVIYVVTALAFDGDGPFLHNLALVGWGFVPAVIGGIVSTAGYYWVFNNRSPGSVSSPQQVQSYMQALQSIPEVQALTALTILVACWQGLIWAHAVKHGRDVAFREAAIAAAIPVVVMVLLSLNTLL